MCKCITHMTQAYLLLLLFCCCCIPATSLLFCCCCIPATSSACSASKLSFCGKWASCTTSTGSASDIMLPCNTRSTKTYISNNWHVSPHLRVFMCTPVESACVSMHGRVCLCVCESKPPAIAATPSERTYSVVK